MFDLALTINGDLMFEQNDDRATSLNISFVVSNSPVLKIGFDTIDCFPLNKPTGALSISFDINTVNNNKRVVLFTDNEALVQLIQIRLNTPLGQIVDRETIGSQLEFAKHKLMNDAKVQALVTSYVYNAIEDILPDAQVTVEPMVSTDNGYEQLMNVYIYDNGILIFKYTIKE